MPESTSSQHSLTQSQSQQESHSIHDKCGKRTGNRDQVGRGSSHQDELTASIDHEEVTRKSRIEVTKPKKQRGFVSDSLASAFSSLDRILVGDCDTCSTSNRERDTSASAGDDQTGSSGNAREKTASEDVRSDLSTRSRQPPAGQGQGQIQDYRRGQSLWEDESEDRSGEIAHTELSAVPKQSPTLRAIPKQLFSCHGDEQELGSMRPLVGGRMLEEMRQHSMEAAARRDHVLEERRMHDAMPVPDVIGRVEKSQTAIETQEEQEDRFSTRLERQADQGFDLPLDTNKTMGAAEHSSGNNTPTRPPTTSPTGSDVNVTPSKRRTYEWAAKRDRRIARRRKEPPMTRRRSQREFCPESRITGEGERPQEERHSEMTGEGKNVDQAAGPSRGAQTILQERTSQTSNEAITSNITSSTDRSSNAIEKMGNCTAWKSAQTQDLTDPSFGDEEEDVEESPLPIRPAVRARSAQISTIRRRKVNDPSLPPLLAKNQLDVTISSGITPNPTNVINMAKDETAKNCSKTKEGTAHQHSDTESETSSDVSHASRNNQHVENENGASDGEERAGESETEEEDISSTRQVEAQMRRNTTSIVGSILLSPPSSQVGKMGRRFLFEPSPTKAAVQKDALVESVPPMLPALLEESRRERWTTNWRGPEQSKKKSEGRSKLSVARSPVQGIAATNAAEGDEIRTSSKRRRLPRNEAAEKEPSKRAGISRPLTFNQDSTPAASKRKGKEKEKEASASSRGAKRTLGRAAANAGPAGIPLFEGSTFLVVGFWGNVARYKRLIVKHGGMLYESAPQQYQQGDKSENEAAPRGERRGPSHIVACLASEKRPSRADVKSWIEEIVKTLDLDRGGGNEEANVNAYSNWKAAVVAQRQSTSSGVEVEFVESGWISDCIAVSHVLFFSSFLIRH